MDIKFLESFVVVVETGSVAAAARRLNLTAAAIMQRLKALEQELGVALVGRVGRTIRPTEAGWAMLPQTRTLIGAARDLNATASRPSFAGELGLGAIASALVGILPPILAQVAEHHPLMRLFLVPGSSDDLYRRADGGELDAAIIVQPEFALPKTCDWMTLREEPLVLLVHDDVHGDDAHEVLRTHPLIRYDRNQWGGRLADAYLRQFGLQTQDRYELDSLDAIAVLVDRRLGVSLVPDWPPPWPAGLSLRRIQLPHPFRKRRIGFMWRRSSARTHLVQALLVQAGSTPAAR